MILNTYDLWLLHKCFIRLLLEYERLAMAANKAIKDKWFKMIDDESWQRFAVCSHGFAK